MFELIVQRHRNLSVGALLNEVCVYTSENVLQHSLKVANR